MTAHVNIRLVKPFVQIEWQLDSYEQADLETFGKICEEIARIDNHLRQFRRQTFEMKRRQRRYQRKYAHSLTYWQNQALKCLRYLFEEKVKP